ncbi:hypothetical protein LJR267_009856 [Paraburkholderia hospita]|uniref:hypothetical protein n=1 Tax=Paraburkholderia hospita TaxID=169430 RepID=UPI003ECC41DC
MSTRVGDAQGAGAVGERQAFNAKTPVCGNIVRVDVTTVMPEMKFAFLQEFQRRRLSWVRTVTVPPVQERRGNFGVEHVALSSAG